MKKRDTLFIGFMLFSMFFGAGNLIFPPMLGAQAGTSFWPAIIGFITTGVGLPFAVLFAISLVEGGIRTIGSRVHPKFATIFIVLVYLCIGPLLAIPRNATVAFEMAAAPFIKNPAHMTLGLGIFTFVFFTLVFLIALKPEKMDKYMGRWMAPALLGVMIILCVVALTHLGAPTQAPDQAYSSGAYFAGFLDGYNTMDALAALAFGIVILTAIQDKGVESKKQLRINMILASLVAGVLLSFVYIFLGMSGARMGAAGEFAAGTSLLSAMAQTLFGPAGKIILGLMFLMACLTSVAGLVSACGQYFSKLISWASHKQVAFGVSLIGFLLANMGLAQILKVSVPFLVTAYPITIMLVVLTFCSGLFRNMRIAYATTILFTGVFALLGGLHAAGLNLGIFDTIREAMPLSSYGLEWVLPGLIGLAAGAIFGLMIPREMEEHTAERVSAEDAV
ncbi:branched-chain amino acid transport system II carrier protein [Aciduricibacillus chroicocephali]|uniref:Branched-chain amino acid transport system carrier protein n=1 Tax=Aciduricibacillus chroicocephali TaxID=3054939 RepID=A0ABY9KV78_9BACI|nr:branched-chain amino acid transport system II carrier protein [Bacillaceae bacterium 44XB]